jgi:hypothetical protein
MMSVADVAAALISRERRSRWRVGWSFIEEAPARIIEAGA